MPRAAAAGQHHTIRAQQFSGKFQHVKTAAAFTRGIVFGLAFGRHALGKLSAMAMAFRIAMDLLIVS